MRSSLSWLDTERLTASLRRAGCAAAEPAKPSGRRFVPLLSPIARDTLEQRLAAFLLWVVETTGCRSAFILDEDGLPLLDQNGEPHLMALSSSISSLLERIPSCLDVAIRGSIALDLSAVEQLQIVPALTPTGRYTLGLVVREPVPRDLVTALEAGLRAAMERSEELIES